MVDSTESVRYEDLVDIRIEVCFRATDLDDAQVGIDRIMAQLLNTEKFSHIEYLQVDHSGRCIAVVTPLARHSGVLAPDAG